MDDRLSRRDMLQRSAVLGVLAVTSAASCGKEKKRLSCIDTSGLAPADLQLRTSPAVAYLDTAADPTKTCERCQQFLPAPAPDTCGTCKVVKGPINPRGGCKLFVAKVA
jgi:hypothetical protein